MDDQWVGVIIAGVAAVAFITNPSIAQHQQQVDALIAQAKKNAASDLALGSYLSLSALDLSRSGHYETYYVMSKYQVGVIGSEIIRCIGFFGQVSCYTPK